MENWKIGNKIFIKKNRKISNSLRRRNFRIFKLKNYLFSIINKFTFLFPVLFDFLSLRYKYIYIEYKDNRVDPKRLIVAGSKGTKRARKFVAYVACAPRVDNHRPRIAVIIIHIAD